ncbi:MAG: CcmD family protein [Calditerrivibrio sp.]|nr:CcmD family protein [Calditerrivibrio sp.]
MKNLEFLFAAYTVIWVLLGAYFFSLNKKIKNLQHKIEQLESDRDRG